MSDINWDEAPEWATSYAKLKNKDWYYYLNDKCYAFYTNLDEVYEYGLADESTEYFLFGDFDVLEKRPQPKPIYTQAMSDAGELPPIGSMFIDVELNDIGDDSAVLAIAHDLPLKRVVYKRGDTLIDSEYFGAVAHECKPIDQRTDSEKAIEDMIEQLKMEGICSYDPIMLRILIGKFKGSKIHGVTFTGEE